MDLHLIEAAFGSNERMALNSMSAEVTELTYSVRRLKGLVNFVCCSSKYSRNDGAVRMMMHRNGTMTDESVPTVK